ncbi:hypothetical protein IEO21_09252 [Rhodonia placenta]|uniref:Alpha/beta hydrolase fold-3 domain-containing protein n=1 Tax=Rhodonia placenta TaxID=104341 RepID=A0A8H7TYE7_9APHY|nr:hypothetical protein IEO21_09252 [Postia placenta]
MAFAFSYQPLKGLYMLGSILLLLFIRLPVWTILGLVPSWRPLPTWSLGRSLIVQAFQAYVGVLFNTAIDTPARPHENAPDARASPGEKVVYHFHGGAFIMGSASPSDPGSKTCFTGYMEHFPNNPRVFGLEYRLTRGHPLGRANPFPSALIDAIAGYRYLVQDVGFEPQNILLSGDSSGGNLAFVLAYYLATYKLPNLPNAGGLLILSPTVDWANTHKGAQSSMVRHSRTDYVGPILNSGYTRDALVGDLPAEAASSVWISPASLKMKVSTGMFSQIPRTCIVVGGEEMTLDAVMTLRDRLQADMGKEAVTYIEGVDCTHDFVTMGWHEPERTNVLREVAVWVDRLWKSV